MSKLTAVGVGILAIVLGIVAKGQNVAFLVGLAFAIAASANLPALLCTIFWKGAKERGIVAGIWTGLVSSTILILISPTVMGTSAIFPLENPGIVSIPLSLVVTVLLSITEKK
jgi:cation/acetate symporter